MSVVLKFVEQERQVLVESRKETMENPEDPLVFTRFRLSSLLTCSLTQGTEIDRS